MFVTPALMHSDAASDPCCTQTTTERNRDEVGCNSTQGAASGEITRIPNDAYYTPDELSRAICSRLVPLIPGPWQVLEPHAGGGSFIRAVRHAWPVASVWAEDIDPASELACVASGAVDWRPPQQDPDLDQGEFDLVIGNPPFTDAHKHIERAMRRVRHQGHAAFLLPLSFLEPVKCRREFQAEHPWAWAIPIAGRPKFRNDRKGSAGMGYVALVWRQGPGPTGLWLPSLHWKPSNPEKEK